MRVELSSISLPVYLDTNIFIYAVDNHDARKHRIARDMLNETLHRGVARYSVQVLAEWRNVMVKKFKAQMSAGYRASFLNWLAEQNPLPMTGGLICRAEDIISRYSISPFDATHIQAALDMSCEYFFSEDMQDGLVIDGRLTIVNPFIAA